MQKVFYRSITSLFNRGVDQNRGAPKIGFQVAKEILDRKVYDSLISLTSKELKKISETGSPPLIAKTAFSIHSMRHSAPGDGVDSWREQK